MRIWLCIAWAAFLFLFLCIWDVAGSDGTRFYVRIAADPSWTGFFGTFNLFEPYMLLRKIGHIFGFAVLQLLLHAQFRKFGVSIGLALAFALATELLQPIFSRHGLLLDVGVDLIGILLAVLAQKILWRQH